METAERVWNICRGSVAVAAVLLFSPFRFAASGRNAEDDSLDANAFANLSAVHQGPLHAAPLHDQGEAGCLQNF